MIRVENKDKFLLLVLLFMVLASLLDIATDLSHSIPFDHIIKEFMLFFFSLVGVLWLLNGLRIQQKEVADLKLELVEAKRKPSNRQPKEYVTVARKRLSDVISQQFGEWSLTPSEKEVGWMLLKGLSLKEIAALRETHEKTVRQQASSLYKKADINGRHAFSAWFIEDIL